MVTYDIYNAVQMFETLLFDNEGVHIILEVVVVEPQTNAVHTEGSEILGVLLRKEILEESVEEKVALVFPEHLE